MQLYAYKLYALLDINFLHAFWLFLIRTYKKLDMQHPQVTTVALLTHPQETKQHDFH